jgi:predicted transcriptional regulator
MVDPSFINRRNIMDSTKIADVLAFKHGFVADIIKTLVENGIIKEDQYTIEDGVYKFS